MTTRPGGRVWDDYARFHHLALATRDVDPVYPVLARLAAGLGLTPGDRVRLVIRHVAYYHLGSALAAFAGEARVLPCGTERRAHRDPRQLHRHLTAVEAIEAAPGGWETWLAPAIRPGDPAGTWHALTARLTGVTGNGRWAAYKTAEMLWKVCGFPAAAPDMGHAHSTGPRHGLALLYDGCPAGNTPADVAHLDRLSAGLCHELTARGLPAPVEEAETTLCDFHALTRGRYYVGHDTDLMLRQVLDVQSTLTPAVLTARAETLPAAYLGERNGWAGPDPARKRAYAATGKILERP